MKKTNRMIWIIIALMMVSAGGSRADEPHYYSDEFETREYKEGQYEITRYLGAETQIALCPYRDSETYDRWDPMRRTILTTRRYYYFDLIAARAFEGSNLVEVVFEEGYNIYWQKIGDYAFRNCKQLRRVTIPNSIDDIGVGVFDGCDLKQLTVTVEPFSAAEKYCRENGVQWAYDENQVQALNAWVYVGYDEALKEYIFDERNTIENSYFAGTNIAQVEFKNDEQRGYAWRKIGQEAFKNCRNLRSIFIPATVKEIGTDAFAGCDFSQLQITVEPGSYADQYCRSNHLPCIYPLEKEETGNVEIIYRPTAEGTAELVSIAYTGRYWMNGGGPAPYPELFLPATVNDLPITKICEGACSAVGFHYTSLVISDSVQIIEDRAIGGGWEKIYIPSGVKVIGSRAFEEADLDHLVFKVDPGSYAETYCKTLRLTWAYLSEEDFYWYITNKDDTAYLIQYNGSEKEITLPRELDGHPITALGTAGEMYLIGYDNYSFTGSDSVETMIIPDTITEIRRTITGFDHLKKLVIPDSVTYISDRAFTSLPAGVTFVVSRGSYAEKYCRDKKLPVSY